MALVKKENVVSENYTWSALRIPTAVLEQLKLLMLWVEHVAQMERRIIHASSRHLHIITPMDKFVCYSHSSYIRSSKQFSSKRFLHS
jgi:hypothetical protein